MFIAYLTKNCNFKTTLGIIYLMKKFLLTLFVMIFPLISLLGISNSTSALEPKQYIKAQTYSYADGKVLQGFYISVNDEFLKENGVSSTETTNFKLVLESLLDGYKKILIAYYSSIHETQDPEFIIGAGGGLEFSEVSIFEGNYIGFQLLFTSRDAWKYYHPSSSGNDSANEGETNVEFVSTISSKGEMIFAQNFLEGITYGQYFANMYLQAGQDTTSIENLESIYQPIFVYEYAVASSKIKSNADYTFYSTANLYHHVWERNFENYLTESEINLYYYQPNTEWWYLTIICIGVMVVVVGTAVCLILNKRKIKKAKI